MKNFLKVLGKVLLVLLVVAVFGFGVLYFFIEFPDPPNSELTTFDHDVIEQFDAWDHSKRGKPDMYIPFPADDYTFYYCEHDLSSIYDDEDGPGHKDVDCHNYNVSVDDNGYISDIDMYDTSTGNIVNIDNVDMSKYLHDGRLCYEVYGVDPAINIDNPYSLSYKHASYHIKDDLDSHEIYYFRGLDTGKIDYHVYDSIMCCGRCLIANYEQGISIDHSASPDSDLLEEGDTFYYRYGNGNNGIIDVESLNYLHRLNIIRHWDGESIIVYYDPISLEVNFIYDIEFNPELDDTLFTFDGLSRYYDLGSSTSCEGS